MHVLADAMHCGAYDAPLVPCSPIIVWSTQRSLELLASKSAGAANAYLASAPDQQVLSGSNMLLISLSFLAYQHALHISLCDLHVLAVMSPAIHPLAGNAQMQAVQGAIIVFILNCS